MTHPPLLLILIVAQQGLIGLMWLGAARIGLARVPALHFAASAMLSALSMAGAAHRGGVSDWISIVLANLAGVLAVLMIRRGVQVFCGAQPQDRQSLLWIGAGAGLLSLGMLADWAWPWLVLITAVLIAWPLWTAASEFVVRLRFEFGPVLARWLAMPLQALALVLLLRGLGAPMFTGSIGAPVEQAGAANIGFGLFLLVAMLLLQSVLAGAVVLRLVRQLQHISAHDPLTAVLNRRGFDEALEREVERLRRYRQPFAVLSIDIDHFKNINDRFGHATGDEVLVSVARVIGIGLRDVDRVGRIGGEEFCVLLPHTEAQSATAVAERLRQQVRERCIGPAACPWQVTVSIGVAIAADPHEGATALLHRLDRALYRAKQEGRDRVQMAENRGGAPQWQTV